MTKSSEKSPNFLYHGCLFILFVYHLSEKECKTLIIISIMVWKMRRLECSLVLNFFLFIICLKKGANSDNYFDYGMENEKVRMFLNNFLEVSFLFSKPIV